MKNRTSQSTIASKLEQRLAAELPDFDVMLEERDTNLCLLGATEVACGAIADTFSGFVSFVDDPSSIWPEEEFEMTFLFAGAEPTPIGAHRLA